MFSKDHLNKILKLNDEYLRANSSRRKEIEEEILALVPDDMRPTSSQQDQKIKELHSQLKEELNKLADCASQQDFDVYFKKLSEIQNTICDHAEELGVELERTDFAEFKKMLETGIGFNK